MIDTQIANKIPRLINVHVHTLWTMYFIGQAVHIMAAAYLGAAGTVDPAQGATNPAQGMIKYLKVKWPVVIARVFVLTMVFEWWIHDPTAASDVARYFGAKLSPGAVHDFLFNVGIPLNVATAGMYGYAADSMLDKVLPFIPWFKNVVPAYLVSNQKAGN